MLKFFRALWDWFTNADDWPDDDDQDQLDQFGFIRK